MNHSHTTISNKPPPLQVVLLAAGTSSRFSTDTTKLIVPLAGKAMILYPLAAVSIFSVPITVVVGFQKELIKKIIDQARIPNVAFVEQNNQSGTGHALLCSKHTWNKEHILVLNGDMPLITQNVIKHLWKKHIKHNATISFAIAQNTEKNSFYGRVLHEKNIRIVEAAHFTGSVKKHPYINAGVYIIQRNFIEQYIHTLIHHEKTRELYITDLVFTASSNNLPVCTLEVPFNVVRGVNTRKELIEVERIQQTLLSNKRVP